MTKPSPRDFEHSVEVESDYHRCQEVRDDIIARARAHRFCDHAVLGIQLALQEALVNAVKHGNADDRAKRIQIDYSVTATEVRIRIADEGSGFDPAAVPDPTAPENLFTPGGRGLLLIRKFMSRVEYHGCGNTVEMWLYKEDVTEV
jgi:serine/threonine-protein kinase RsbW